MTGPALALVFVSSAPLLAPLLTDARLAPAAAAHPAAVLDASEVAAPERSARPGGGTRWTFLLPLREPGGPELVAADVAADFDAADRFVGTRLLTVRPPAVFSVSGEVRRGESFEAPVDSTRTFRLAPFTEGWTIEVRGPGGDFCRPLTPPYRGVNALEVFGNAPGELRAFRCAATEAERSVADASLKRVLWTDNVPWKQVDEAVAAHERLRALAQRGRFLVREIQLGNLGPGKRPWIERLRFRFELRPAEAGEP